MNRYTRYIFGLLGIIVIFLSIDIHYKYQKFSQYHQKLSHKTVTSSASEIETMLNSLRRELELFVTQEKKLLSKLYFNPQNKVSRQQLEQKVKDYFPQYLEFTIADHLGNIILNRNIFAAYPQCRKNIEQTAQIKQQPLLSLHNNPGSKKQHYDVIYSFKPIDSFASDSINSNTSRDKKHENEALFFISYHNEPLKILLSHRHIEHHSLFVVKTHQPDQIEFLASDTLSTLKKNGLIKANGKTFTVKTLHSEEKQSIKGTLWTIVDILDPQYRQKKIFTLIVQHVFLLVFFIIISALFIRAIRDEIKNSTNTQVLLKGVENERRRISMEMHDQILADITHLSRKIMSSEPMEKNEINEYLLSFTSSIRDLIDDLHPNSLDLLGIEAAIRSYINKHLSATEFPDYAIQIASDVEQNLQPYQKYTLFRILIELVNNIINHAQCTQYAIKGSLSNGYLNFKVEDNGIGLQKKDISDTGQGLNNIKSRCQMLGANISIIDNIPQGTTVILKLEPTRLDC